MGHALGVSLLSGFNDHGEVNLFVLVEALVKHIEPVFTKVMDTEMPKIGEIFRSLTLKMKNLEEIRLGIYNNQEFSGIDQIDNTGKSRS